MMKSLFKNPGGTLAQTFSLLWNTAKITAVFSVLLMLVVFLLTLMVKVGVVTATFAWQLF